MKLYVSDIEELYKETIIVNPGKSDTAYLLLHIVQCWCACAANEENRALPIYLYCSQIMCKYFSCLVFSPFR